MLAWLTIHLLTYNYGCNHTSAPHGDALKDYKMALSESIYLLYASISQFKVSAWLKRRATWFVPGDFPIWKGRIFKGTIIQFYSIKTVNISPQKLRNIYIESTLSRTIFNGSLRWYIDCISMFNIILSIWYIWSKVNIWNVNRAWATAFIFDIWTGVLQKVSKFLRQKMSRPGKDSNPQPSDLCRML